MQRLSRAGACFAAALLFMRCFTADANRPTASPQTSSPPVQTSGEYLTTTSTEYVDGNSL
jgi:hypothetical protein